MTDKPSDDPYSRAKGPAFVSPDSTPPATDDEEEVALLTPTQRARWARQQRENAEATRREPTWRQQRTAMLRDPCELARFLDRYHALMDRYDKQPAHVPTLSERLLDRQFHFTASSRAAGPTVWPSSRYLRAALALTSAYVDSPEGQVEAAFALAKRAPGRMRSLYQAVTSGPPWPAWERITRTLVGTPAPGLAHPLSLSQLPQLKQQWERIETAAHEILQACRVIDVDLAVDDDPASKAFERQQEIPVRDQRRADAVHEAEERADRLTRKKYEDSVAQGQPLAQAKLDDLFDETYQRVLRQRGFTEEYATTKVRDPEVAGDRISRVDPAASLAARVANLASERLMLIEWFLRGSHDEVAARGPHALASSGDVAVALYGVLGGRVARRRGDRLKALSRTKQAFSAIWGIEFSIDALRQRVAKRSGRKTVSPR